MFFKTTMIAAALVSVATMARADAAAGDACAAKLTADGKLVYAAVVAANATLQNLRETVEHQARELVFAGKIARAEGRDNAVAAGECVRTRLQ
jgi:hypothetical protein